MLPKQLSGIGVFRLKSGSNLCSQAQIRLKPCPFQAQIRLKPCPIALLTLVATWPQPLPAFCQQPNLAINRAWPCSYAHLLQKVVCVPDMLCGCVVPVCGRRLKSRRSCREIIFPRLACKQRYSNQGKTYRSDHCLLFTILSSNS